MPGTILRSGYVRKAYTRSDGVRVKRAVVPATRITDRGLPGKGPKVIPTLKKGVLGKYGYTSRKSAVKRHSALKRAESGESYKRVIDQLVAVRTLNRNTNPRTAKVFNSDIKWMQAHH